MKTDLDWVCVCVSVKECRCIMLCLSISRLSNITESSHLLYYCCISKEYICEFLQLYSLLQFKAFPFKCESIRSKLFLILNHTNLIWLHFFLLFRLHAAQQWCEIDFYETYSTFFFPWVTNRRASLDHVLHVLSETRAVSVHASEWSTARVRVCVVSVRAAGMLSGNGWSPTGRWHFLSVYGTAYPPQD